MHWWEQAKPVFAHRGYSATGMRDHWVSFMVPASLKLNQTAFYPKGCGQMQRNLEKKNGLCTCQTPRETVFVWAHGQCQTDGGKAAVGAAGRLAWACSTQSPSSASCLLLSKVCGPSLSLCVSLLVQNIWKVERNSGAQDNRIRELCQGLDCPSFS